jgi:hypothetical protein
MAEKIKVKWNEFRAGFWRGIGSSFGITVGFIIISTIGILILQLLGGLPLVGRFFADILEATQLALKSKS